VVGDCGRRNAVAVGLLVERLARHHVGNLEFGIFACFSVFFSE
jgi:hypothetical protein